MQTIQEKLRIFIAQNILFSQNGFPYDDETSFLENGIVDSASVIELVLFIEEQYGISVKDSEVVPQNFDSIQNLSRYITRKTQDV